MKPLSLLILFAVLAGCGGFRGGIQSVPYVGEPPTQGQPAHPTWPHTLVLPGVTVELSFNNALRTYQYEVMLFVIPTYLNFWDEFRNREAEALELTLQLEARDAAMVVDLRQLVLMVDGQEVRPNGVWVNNPERERRVIEDFVKARREAPKNQPPETPRAAEWRDTITDPLPIASGERSPRFIVIFPLPLLSPEKDILLNMGPAIVEPRNLELPLIRFRSTPWSDAYS